MVRDGIDRPLVIAARPGRHPRQFKLNRDQKWRIGSSMTSPTDWWTLAVVAQSYAYGYGYSFSDSVSGGGVNPQISVYEKSLSPEQNVTELYI